jgi:hypothetical protein
VRAALHRSCRSAAAASAARPPARSSDHSTIAMAMAMAMAMALVRHGMAYSADRPPAVAPKRPRAAPQCYAAQRLSRHTTGNIAQSSSCATWCGVVFGTRRVCPSGVTWQSVRCCTYALQITRRAAHCRRTLHVARHAARGTSPTVIHGASWPCGVWVWAHRAQPRTHAFDRRRVTSAPRTYATPHSLARAHTSHARTLACTRACA